MVRAARHVRMPYLYATFFLSVRALRLITNSTSQDNTKRKKNMKKEATWQCPIDGETYCDDDILVWDPEHDLPECPDHAGTHLIPLD